ncbi:MFS transporter [uncultured Ruminococcus sp.]|uniref:MFS transporter n=1 Tax=uncultured Ruminococcus sp. TaxID=165186 RepID=UPI0025EF5420|nr:MFS transporter [uncultured Ruminococcus sp.]MDY4964172.1 MFS transporter [Ruminococcus callidus]
MIAKNELRDFYILWSTQSISQLGSSITAFALTLWLYEQTGSSLGTAMLTICSYAPYVIMSIFAGALTDRFDKKKTMLVCDVLAVMCTVAIFILYKTNTLMIWHLYAINAFSGLMNTVQQPAAEVAMTLIIPERYYQKTSGLRSLSRSLVSTLNPLIAASLYALIGLTGVIAVDIGSFAVAFAALLFLIKIPESKRDKTENVLVLAKEGLMYLKANPMIMTMILFLSGVNLIASAFDGILPGLVLPNPKGGSSVLGLVTSCSGIAMIIGSLLVSVLPKPKDRIKVVYLTMLISLGTENFLLAFSREPIVWCVGQIIGWVLVPVMSANYDVIFKTTVPVELQGRVYACRNTMQFFTIPIGLFLGGFMVDNVCEPIMSRYGDLPLLTALFGTGKGSGAALMMFIIGIGGVLICLFAGKKLKNYHYNET